MSKQCTAVKALAVKYQIKAHRLWHVTNKVCHSTVCIKAQQLREQHVEELYYTMIPTLANCRLSLNTAWLVNATFAILAIDIWLLQLGDYPY